MGDETYTPEEVAKLLKISKYTVYEMVKRGELRSYRIGNKVRVDQEDLQAFIEMKKGPSSVEPTSEGAQPRPINHPSAILRLAGSHDFLVEHLVQYLSTNSPSLSLHASYIGSLEGLMMLHRGLTDVAAIHLLDPHTGDYNIPFIERIFIQEPIRVVHLAKRNQGFIVARENPKKIKDWTDLTRGDIRFVNRQKGSGTRFLLDHHLSKKGIATADVMGYENEEWNHFASASAVARGAADVTLGIESAAARMGLTFIPLAEERFDLIVRLTPQNQEVWELFYSILCSLDFRKSLHEFEGYDFSRLGEIIIENIS
ncbi:substrate-binding domain-containing protein [Ammoniphilus sp. 3BR4]|uniref:substrate-binding domain-containing protein n=1 Tax=Ammoniphilus sp. 3BR4 TaxID=3158265 RepID=UPI003465018D